MRDGSARRRHYGGVQHSQASHSPSFDPSAGLPWPELVLESKLGGSVSALAMFIAGPADYVRPAVKPTAPSLFRFAEWRCPTVGSRSRSRFAHRTASVPSRSSSGPRPRRAVGSWGLAAAR
ncbi:MAG: hypothetical protein ACE37F_09630 [Nannocystaceae bacterium]|nr:hypothetical protein [bacterium]